MTAARWQPVIGLEVHVQLATVSKAFSGAPAGFGAPPNSQCDPVVLALPGALPVFNAAALELALRLGLACGSAIRPVSRFARKHYFYPDLPKGYQISQYEEPLCEGGAIEVELGGAVRAVALRRIHLEEDAGKNLHQTGGAVSQVDLNRAGVPLIEVVSEPDLFSADEAAEYMRTLRQLCRWLDISGGDMEKGQLRCDANVSLRLVGSSELGTRAELKNINSFKFVHHAIEHEIARQARILDQGGHVVQETRLWDAEAGRSQSMRSKEEAMDYRYFPDPDLPPMAVDEALLASARAHVDRVAAFREALRTVHRLTRDESEFVASDLSYFEELARADSGDLRTIVHWLQQDPSLKEVNTDVLTTVSGTVSAGELSHTAAKALLPDLKGVGLDVAREMISDRAQLSDAGAIEAACREIVAAHPAEAASYRAGKAQLIGFFVGQVMKKTGGRADPKLVNQTLRRMLAEGERSGQ